MGQPSTPLASVSATERRSAFCDSMRARLLSNTWRLASLARRALPLGRRKLRAYPFFTFTTSPMAPSFSILSRRMMSMSIGSLLHDVGEEAEMARALDRLGEFALLLGRDGGDAAGNDLAPLRDEALEQADVLIVDAGGVLAGKGAGLAAAEKGACHDVSSFSLSVGEVGTGGAVATIRTVAARAAITAVATITTVAALAVALAAPHHRGGA